MKKIPSILAIILLLPILCYAKDFIKDKQLYKVNIGEDSDEVIIGDEKTPDIFKSQITFTKWDKENSLTIIPNIPVGTPTITADKSLEIGDSKIGFYYKPDQDDNDTLKFGLILKEKPATNSWNFQIEDGGKLDYFYQYCETYDVVLHPEILIGETPDYWEIEYNGRSMQIFKKYYKGYAVYHKTKRDHWEGHIDYKIGKIGYFLVPKFIDAIGKIVQGSIIIQNGIYSVFCPQDFLDMATYPVKANDTFGNTTQPTFGTDLNQNNPNYSPATSTPASNGSLTSMTVYGHDVNGTAQFCAAIYSSTGTAPNARLAALAEGAGTTFGTSTGGSWITSNISYGSIVAGTQYNLGCKSGTNGRSYRLWYDNGSTQFYRDWATEEAWPATATTDGSWSIKPGIYATYTPSGGAVTPRGQIITIQTRKQ